MFTSVKFWVASVGIGLVAGLSIAGWMQWHASTATPIRRTTNGSLSASDSLLNGSGSGSSSGGNNSSLSVITDGDQGSVSNNTGAAQNAATSSGQTDSSGSSSSSSSSSSALPGPSDFAQYNSYKASPTALYIDVQAGSGAAIANGSVATVQYEGWLTNGTEFDSTYARKEAYTFTEGAGAVIPGWEEAIFGMKVGGERRLIVPPGLAFGATAHGPIPANSVLIFDVSLVSIK